MRGKLLLAATLACAAIGPALAYSQGPAFEAYDYGFKAVPGGGTLLSVSKGATVTFSYPSGSKYHNVYWEQKKPKCNGVPDENSDILEMLPGWSGTCTFEDTGEYPFVCTVHPEMTAKVEVKAPAPSATATATADPSATPGAYPTPTPTATATPTGSDSKPLAVKLAKTQRGSSVRGSVTIAQAASRLEVTVTIKRRRAGRYVKTAAAGGTRSFTVRLDARARRELARKRSLKVSVAVAVTAPGASKQLRTFGVTLRG